MTQQVATYAGPQRLRARSVITPLDQALGAQVGLTWMHGWLSRIEFNRQLDEAENGRIISRWGGRQKPTSPLLTKAQAEEVVRQAGLEGEIDVGDGLHARTLNLKIERRQEEQRKEGLIARADQSFGTQLMLGAAAFGTEFVDPINLATLFVPAVGEAKLAYWITKGMARFGPTATKLAVRAGVGAYEGATGTAITEPLNYALTKSVGDDYDFVERLMNVGLGAVAGGALHAVGGAGVDLYRGMRVRGYLSIDAFGRVINRRLDQLGFGRGKNVAESIAAEHGALVVADEAEGGASRFVLSATSLPPDTTLVLPGVGSELGDLVGIKSVIRDLVPVTMSATEEIYRKKSGDDILVYTRTADSSADREAFTVQRLKPDDPDYAGPLSEQRMVEDAEASRRSSRLLFIKAPEEMDRVLTDAAKMRLTELEKGHDADPLKLYPPEADGGYKVDVAVGTAVHKALSTYADTSKVLHRGWKLEGKIPDGFASTDYAPMALEMKPESPSGISLGAEQARGYENTFGVEAGVLLYSRHEVQKGIDDLNEKVIAAWNKYDEKWPEFLTKAGKERLKEAGIDPRLRLPNRPSKSRKRVARLEPQTTVQKVNKGQGKQP